MWTITRLGILLVICGSFTFNNKGSAKLKINISLQSRLDRQLAVKVILINNTPDTVIYQSMSCSWCDYYITNTPDVSLSSDYFACDKNIPLKVKILPYSKEEKIISYLLADKIPETTVVSFKIGFNYIPVKENENISLFNWHPPAKRNYIWSNSLSIP